MIKFIQAVFTVLFFIIYGIFGFIGALIFIAYDHLTNRNAPNYYGPESWN